VQHVNRGASTRFAALEALQLIGGVSAPKIMKIVAPNTAQFLSHTPTGTEYFHGAYGVRTGEWVHRAVQRLRDDPDTRQAVLNIWDNRHDQRLEPDLPCTLTLHFMLRNFKLDLHVTMRSNDVWWGTAYDIFVFTQLQVAVARTLNVPLGTYYHHANSLHIYARDYEKLEKLISPTQPADKVPALGVRNGTWLEAQNQATKILYNEAANLDWWTAQANTWAQGLIAK
jgi:thymidylate synthase